MSLRRVVFGALLPVLVMAQSGVAGAGEIYRCTEGDRTVFQDKPCPGGVEVEIPPPPDPAEVRAAQERANQVHERVKAAERAQEAALHRQAAVAARQESLREKKCRRMQADLAKAEAKAARHRNPTPDRLVALKRERYLRVCQ